MLDIHLISYNNIWPWEDKLITIALKQGKYLIKSPIWSGKSFLFFDGILYGLYGHSYRDALNKNSTTWYIKILFSIENEYYLIVRNLGKNKNLKSLEFYLLSYDQDEIDHIVSSYPDIITFDKDFTDDLSPIKLEHIDLVRIPEIEENIRNLLPPRQVFEHRNMFMQNSDNIFELQPKQRIDLLKQIFNLDFLETYKTKLSDDKNQLSTQIKILEKDTSYQDKYTKIWDFVKEQYNIIASRSYHDALEDDDIQKLSDVLSHPLSDNRDHVDHTLFELKFDKTWWYIDKQKSDHNQLSHTKKLLQEQVWELQHQINAHQQEMSDIRSKLQSQDIDEIDMDVLHKLELSKSDIQTQMDEIDDDKYDSMIIGFVKDKWNKCLTINNIADRISVLDEIVSMGKEKKSSITELELEKEKITSQFAQLEQKIQSSLKQLALLSVHEFESYKNTIQEEIQHKQYEHDGVAMQISQQQELLRGVEEALAQQQAKRDRSMTFYCKRIEANCPFLDQINDKVISGIKWQIDHIKHQRDSILHRIQTLTTSKVPIQSGITSLLNKLSESKIEDYQFVSKPYLDLQNSINLQKSQLSTWSHKLELSKIQSQIDASNVIIEDIRWLFERIGGYNAFATIYNTWSSLKQQLQDMDTQIISYQKDISLIQQKKLQQAEQSNKISTLERDIDLFTKQISQNHHKIADLEQDISAIDMSWVDTLHDATDRIKRSIARLEDMYADDKDRQLKISSLKSDLEVSAWLYDVFNKEFMLYAMQNYLPTLSDAINAHLYKIVDYQVYIGVNDEWDALDIVIKDHLWDRDVKSLSGGQRAILRLCWILAICSIWNNKILFMDETINNIDPDTIGKVADLLTDFIRQNDIKFYTVTHSTQIQQMNIRDSVIEVTR